MRWPKFILSLLCTVGLLALLYFPVATPLSLGDFFNPFQGFWQNAQPQGSQLDGEIDLIDLQDKVQVNFDARGVPHIFAENLHDLAYTQGYITAKDRLWQMEFQVRSAAGRLTEVVGRGPNDAVLKMDRGFRRKGMIMAAERAWEEAQKDAETKKTIEAYSAGVNAWIEQLDPADYPIEYKLLEYEPEEWSPFKTCLLLKYMAHNLSFRGSEIPYTHALQRFGREKFDLLYPRYAYKEDPIVPVETQFNRRIAAPPPTTPENYYPDSLFVAQLADEPSPNLGSNNWAISGSKSVTGYPILANDPHLGLNLPAIWYEVQLNMPGMNVYGVSLPGAPGIVIGFNEFIAWGLTNGSVDVIDYYKIRFQDDKKEAYYFDGQWLPVKEEIETFTIKGEEPIYDTIYYTHHGPVIYDEAFGETEAPLALKWMAHKPSNDVLTFLGLMRAKTYDDYEQAISTYSCPAQNFVFASASGDIAIWQMGDYVNRWPEQGRFILDGTRKDHDWQGEIPWQQHPHVFNPREGHVSSANQHPTSPLYPYYYGGRFASYRGRRIKSLLTENDSLSSNDLKAFQLDNHNLMAEDILPLMLTELDSLPLNGDQVKVKNLLTSWNYAYEGDLVAPSLFEAWWRELYNLIWKDEFGNAEVPLTWPSSSTTVGLLRDSMVQRFYRTPADTSLKTRTDLVKRSFQSAIDSFFVQYPNEEDWLWQKRQGTDIRHLARVISSFHRSGLPTNGTGNALNAIKKSHGPSWRMVVELGPQPKAYGIYPGGQSGNPGDKAYDQFVDDWVDGNYYPLWLMRDANDIRDSIQSKVVFK